MTRDDDGAFEYTREFLTDLQQVYELAADEAEGIKDYLVAIQDTNNPQLKALLRGILEQEREHLRKLVAYADACHDKNPKGC